MRNLTFQIGSKFEAAQPKARWFGCSLEQMRSTYRPVPARPARLSRNCDFKDRIAVVSKLSHAA